MMLNVLLFQALIFNDKVIGFKVDTRQYIEKGRPKAYFFKAYSKVKNPKVGSFLRAPEDFEGLRSRKEKMTKTPSFFGKKIN